uniref:Cytochrome P450 n=1 Tax=Acrobeloides nanus TaxID=290746 RepID=A0A914CI65_9BILA
MQLSPNPNDSFQESLTIIPTNQSQPSNEQCSSQDEQDQDDRLQQERKRRSRKVEEPRRQQSEEEKRIDAEIEQAYEMMMKKIDLRDHDQAPLLSRRSVNNNKRNVYLSECFSGIPETSKHKGFMSLGNPSVTGGVPKKTFHDDPQAIPLPPNFLNELSIADQHGFYDIPASHLKIGDMNFSIPKRYTFDGIVHSGSHGFIIDISPYLAPELLFNRSIKNRKDNPDLAADIWSIGCIFAELLTGKILYDTAEILPMALPQEYLLWRKIFQVLRVSSLNDEEEVEICIRNNNESISINYDPLLWTDLFPDSIFQIFPLDSDNARNITQVPTDPYDFLDWLQILKDKALGAGEEVVRIFIGTKMYVFPITGEALKPIVESNTELKKSVDYDFFEKWLGLGLLISTDDKWRYRRKMLTPSFHFNMLEGFVEIFDRESRIFVNLLEKHANTGEMVDLSPRIKNAALDIICATAMGVDLNAQGDPHQPYVECVEKFSLIAWIYNMNPAYWIETIWYLFGHGFETERTLKILKGFTHKVIKERAEAFDDMKKNGQTFEKKRLAFLDMLLNMKDENQLTFEDIREEVDTFMFEGHDTTSSGISWTCWCMATHPEIQELVYKEIYDRFGDSDREVTLEDLKELKYLERCLKEAMRLFPPVPMVHRALREDLKMGNKIVPKGAMVVFPDSMTYNPDNFLSEKISERHSYSYVPFSAGPRNCIGQKFAMYEELTMMIWILRRYKLSTTYKIHDNRPGNEAILRPKLGIPVKLERRN